MRARTVFLIVIIALLVGFAMLNVDEFTRISTLNLGVTTMQVPLGLMMLVLSLAILLAFLVTTLVMHSANLIEHKKHAKELAAQRDLADKAEASRFTELRNSLNRKVPTACNANQQRRRLSMIGSCKPSLRSCIGWTSRTILLRRILARCRTAWLEAV